MKVRNGFVSNSSSSSFCIYGATFDDPKDFAKLFEGTDVDVDGIGMGEVSEELNGYGTKKKNKLPAGFECHCPSYSDTLYVGKSWSTVKDNETGKEFKESVKTFLEELLGKKVKCDSFEESWQDG
jgi:hypothetical protein